MELLDSLRNNDTLRELDIRGCLAVFNVCFFLSPHVRAEQASSGSAVVGVMLFPLADVASDGTGGDRIATALGELLRHNQHLEALECMRACVFGGW